MENAKRIWQSKTFWAGLATILTGVGLYVNGEQGIQELAMSVVGVIFIILRLATSQPIVKIK